MKKSEYVTKISEKLHLTKKEVEMVTDEFINELIESICQKDTVSITNFGTFKKTILDSYTYFSPINGEKQTKKGVARISFTISKDLSKKLSRNGE